MKLLALPGFLGTTEDFTPFLQEFRRQSGSRWDVDVLAISNDAERGPSANWGSWSQVRRREIHDWKGSDRLVGIGYSLGGRLLLSIAGLDPFLFDALIFLSVNPGLSDMAEKRKRLDQDEAWARRFEKDPWIEVVTDWNKQPVFQSGAAGPLRREDDYFRSGLGRLLRSYSLALQPDYTEAVARWNAPQLWLVGENDVKFKAILENLQRTNMRGAKNFNCETIPKAAHRLLSDQPAATAQKVAQWLSHLNLDLEINKNG